MNTTMKKAPIKKIQTLARRYPRFIRWSDEDNCYIGSLPDLDGDCTHGDTPDEVARNLDECAEIYVADCLDDGTPLPEPNSFIVSPSRFRQQGAAGRVQALRKSRGMSQKDFAAFLGVSASSLIKWENGVRKPCGAAARLLEICAAHPELVR